jgi:hypothetical protein
MDGISAASVAKLVGEGGIFGLGWILFIFMMFREVRERKRYSDLVIHIIQYFTKIRMVERDESSLDIPAELFDVSPTRRKPQRSTRSNAGRNDNEEAAG